MAIKVNTGFEINTAKPVDNRLVKQTVAERDAIPLTWKYDGLSVLVLDNSKEYRWVGGSWFDVTPLTSISTASYASSSLSASYATSASYAVNTPASVSSSHADSSDNSISASYATSASYAVNTPASVSSSHADWADNAVTASYALTVPATASNALTAATASVVTYGASNYPLFYPDNSVGGFRIIDGGGTSSFYTSDFATYVPEMLILPYINPNRVLVTIGGGIVTCSIVSVSELESYSSSISNLQVQINTVSQSVSTSSFSSTASVSVTASHALQLQAGIWHNTPYIYNPNSGHISLYGNTVTLGASGSQSDELLIARGDTQDVYIFRPLISTTNGSGSTVVVSDNNGYLTGVPSSSLTVASASFALSSNTASYVTNSNVTIDNGYGITIRNLAGSDTVGTRLLAISPSGLIVYPSWSDNLYIPEVRFNTASVQGTFTGSLEGSASYARSASNALSSGTSVFADTSSLSATASYFTSSAVEIQSPYGIYLKNMSGTDTPGTRLLAVSPEGLVTYPSWADNLIINDVRFATASIEGKFTGSLQGSASYALSASKAFSSLVADTALVLATEDFTDVNASYEILMWTASNSLAGIDQRLIYNPVTRILTGTASVSISASYAPAAGSDSWLQINKNGDFFATGSLKWMDLSAPNYLQITDATLRMYGSSMLPRVEWLDEGDNITWLEYNGSTNILSTWSDIQANAFRGNLIGTADTSSVSVSASYAITASYVLNSLSASHAVTTDVAIYSNDVLVTAENFGVILLVGTAYAGGGVTSLYNNQDLEYDTDRHTIQGHDGLYQNPVNLNGKSRESDRTTYLKDFYINSSGSINENTSAVVVVQDPIQFFYPTSSITSLEIYPSQSFRSAFYDYYISDGTNQRAGMVMATWLANGTITYNEQATFDIGNTSGVTLSVAINGGYVQLLSNASGTWTVKARARYL